MSIDFSLDVPFDDPPIAPGCRRCGRETGHERTCPNGNHPGRYVDIDVMLERIEAEDGDDEPADGQVTLFGEDDAFRIQWQEWRGMPEFIGKNIEPFKTLIVRFETEEHYRAFAELIGQGWMTSKTKSVWYPEAEWARERGVAQYADVSLHDEQEVGI